MELHKRASLILLVRNYIWPLLLYLLFPPTYCKSSPTLFPSSVSPEACRCSSLKGKIGVKHEELPPSIVVKTPCYVCFGGSVSPHEHSCCCRCYEIRDTNQGVKIV